MAVLIAGWLLPFMIPALKIDKTYKVRRALFLFRFPDLDISITCLFWKPALLTSQ